MGRSVNTLPKSLNEAPAGIVQRSAWSCRVAIATPTAWAWSAVQRLPRLRPSSHENSTTGSAQSWSGLVTTADSAPSRVRCGVGTCRAVSALSAANQATSPARCCAVLPGCVFTRRA